MSDSELQRAMVRLDRAWSSLYAAFDALHDMDEYPTQTDESTLLLICLKEMSNAVGYAKKTASEDGERPGGRSRREGRDDVRAELTKELAAKQLRQAEAARKQAKAKAPRRRKGRR